MRALNLDSEFQPIQAPEVKFDHFYFPGGEYSIKIKNCDTTDSHVVITHRISKPAFIIEILMAVNALRNQNIEKIDLIIPYIPYARQDRICDKGEALSIKVFAELINSLSLNKVIVLDPHSDVSSVLINNILVIDNYKLVRHAIFDYLKLSPRMIGEGEKIEEKRLPLIVSPDAGALKKIYSLSSKLHREFNVEIVEGSKHRDTKTGKLTGFNISNVTGKRFFHNGEIDLQGQDCFIVDDICDGGGTFLGLAKSLKDHNAGKLYLVVTHGIFSKGLEIFEDVFEKIYTSNSFKTTEHSLVNQYKILI